MDWLATTYDALSAAARDEALPTNDLDRVYREYAQCESGFRHVFMDFEQNWSVTAQKTEPQ